jgi:hypothetical protein
VLAFRRTLHRQSRQRKDGGATAYDDHCWTQLTTIRPCRPHRGDARPILLGCPNAFFEADAVPIEEPPNRTDAGLLLTFTKQATL